MYTLSIDRISVVLPILDKEYFYHFVQTIWSMAGDPGYVVWKGNYMTTAKIPLGGGRSFRLIAGVSHHKTFVRVDFGPASLNEDNWEQLTMHMSLIFDGGYKTLYHSGVVTYLEIAVDCIGIDSQGLLPFDSALKNSTWYPPFPALKATAYLGRRGGKRVVRVYDRVERLKIQGVVIDGPMTRVEAVLRRVNRTIPKLQLTANPFVTVGICEFVNALAAHHDDQWKKFLHDCRLKGAPRALGISGPLRKLYLKRLKGVACNWWTPTEVWNQYPAALKILETPMNKGWA